MKVDNNSKQVYFEVIVGAIGDVKLDGDGRSRFWILLYCIVILLLNSKGCFISEAGVYVDWVYVWVDLAVCIFLKSAWSIWRYVSPNLF